jgi:hypothetical protein
VGDDLPDRPEATGSGNVPVRFGQSFNSLGDSLMTIFKNIGRVHDPSLENSNELTRINEFSVVFT